MSKIKDSNENNIKLVKKQTPPEVTPCSPQYDLFASFLGDKSELSNTIELWDAIPKFCISKRSQNNLRDKNGRLPVQERDFVYRFSKDRISQSVNAELSIRPALIREKEGFKDYYPSINEELVLEVLIKIFADQNYGVHDSDKKHSWVKFTLSMIRKELKDRGKTKSIAQIKQSLEILGHTNLEVNIKNEGADLSFSGNILQDMATVNRDKYIKDGKAQWCVRLPHLLTDSIDKKTYRQFNYGKLMGLDCQLERWIFKLLAHRFTNAALDKTFNIKLSTIIRDSGYLNNALFRVNLHNCKKSLDQLCKEQILLTYKADALLENGRQIDTIFNLTPHPFFTTEIKAANARLNRS